MPSVSDADFIAAWEKYGSPSLVANELKISERAAMSRRRSVERRTGKSLATRNDMRVSGTSTLVNAEGNVVLQWVKELRSDNEREAAFRAAVDEMARALPRVPAIPAPAKCYDSLCTVYTLTDAHVGMKSWAQETGEDWDLGIAEEVLTGCFYHLVGSAPKSKVAIVNQLGDFLHADGLVPATPTSGHILDMDSRFQKVVEAAVRILRKIVAAALKKHDQVRLYLHEGNHDPASSVWLRTLFSAIYEDEPRVHVETSPSPYIAYRHGKVMLGFHHGHLAKKTSLPLLFAAKYPEIWGATPRGRYVHVGHLHHVDEKEHPGVTVIQHPTLAAPDAYSARGGWLSRRQATAITYHSEFGEYARNVIVPEMLE